MQTFSQGGQSIGVWQYVNEVPIFLKKEQQKSGCWLLHFVSLFYWISHYKHNNCQVSYCMFFLCFIRLFCFILLHVTWYFFHPLSKQKLFLKRMVSCLECLCCNPFFCTCMFTTCMQCIWFIGIWWIKHLFCLTC